MSVRTEFNDDDSSNDVKLSPRRDSMEGTGLFSPVIITESSSSKTANETDESLPREQHQQQYPEITRAAVKEQTRRLGEMNQTLERLWNTEIANYELKQQAHTSNINDTTASSPLSQQWLKCCYPEHHNKDTKNNIKEYGCLEEFPYHTFLQPLTECFRCPPRSLLVGGQFPCPPKSIFHTLFPSYGRRIVIPNEEHDKDHHQQQLSLMYPEDDDDFRFMQFWEDRIVDTADVNADVGGTTITRSLPLIQKYRRQIVLLLRLLRHAASEIQMDLRLGRAVLLLFTDHGYLDLEDGDAILPLLAVMGKDYVYNCWGACQRRRDDDDMTHDCDDFQNYITTLPIVISRGITHMTSSHATSLLAFVLNEYSTFRPLFRKVDDDCITTPSSLPTTNDNPSDRKVKILQKNLLKENLFYYQSTTYQHPNAEDNLQQGEERFRIQMVLGIIVGLGQHAQSDRRKVQQTQNMSKKQSMLSWANCVRTLVDIADHSLYRLPPTTSNAEVGGELVRAFVRAFVDDDERHDRNTATTLPSATRFAHAVMFASDSVYSDDSSSSSACFRMKPSADVQRTVRNLFLCDMVSIAVSGCGYGDWLTACRLSVTPLDPLLFDHRRNYTTVRNTTQAAPPLEDESGVILNDMQLAARYDFSVMLLMQAWHCSTWTPDNHRSHSYHARHAFRALIFCTNRYRVPSELNLMILSFVPARTWWNDCRRKCWYMDCQLKELKVTERERIRNVGAANNNEVITAVGIKSTTKPIHDCPGCGVAMYCCEEHRKYMVQDGHRRYCGFPPFRIPGEEEASLCLQVYNYNRDVLPSQYLTNSKSHLSQRDEITPNEIENDDCEDSSSSCWESVDSSEDGEPSTVTDIIHKFFDEKAYKGQEIEPPAFANIYTFHN